MTVSRVSDSFSENIAAQIEAKRKGFRKLVNHCGTLCSKCYQNPPASPTQRYCKLCRASYQSAYSKKLRANWRDSKRLKAMVGEG